MKNSTKSVLTGAFIGLVASLLFKKQITNLFAKSEKLIADNVVAPINTAVADVATTEQTIITDANEIKSFTGTTIFPTKRTNWAKPNEGTVSYLSPSNKRLCDKLNGTVTSDGDSCVRGAEVLFSEI